MNYDIALIWNPVVVPDFDHYNIYRSVTAPGVPPWTLIGESTKPAYIDKDLPIGTYYYVVTAVDKIGNESTPSSVVTKTSPPETSSPATPTGLLVHRTNNRQGVELNWNENAEEDIKGYIIERQVWDNATPPGYTILAITSSNKYVDSAIPFGLNTTFMQSYVRYKIYAFDKYNNVSTATGATNTLIIPTATSIRGIVDYLSINVYFELPLPEKATVTTIYPYVLVGSTWYRGMYLDSGGTPHDASVAYPGEMVRIDGYNNSGFVAFAKGTNYGISVKLNTTAPATPQDGYVLIQIPDYDADTTAPHDVLDVYLSVDSDTDIGYLTWARNAIDDDLMYYEISYVRIIDTSIVVLGTTTLNNYTIRDLRSLHINGSTSVRIRIVAVDRSGNRSTGVFTTFPLDVDSNVPFTVHNPCTYIRTKVFAYSPSASDEGFVAKFEVNWRSSDLTRKEFRYYVVYVWDPDTETIDYTDEYFIYATVKTMNTTILTRQPGGWTAGTKRRFLVGVLDEANIIHVNPSDYYEYVET